MIQTEIDYMAQMSGYIPVWDGQRSSELFTSTGSEDRAGTLGPREPGQGDWPDDYQQDGRYNQPG